MSERVCDVRDVRPRPQHVVAPTVEGEVRGPQCQRRLQLLAHDGPHELAADGEVGVLDGLPEAGGPAFRGEVGPPAHGAVGQLIAYALDRKSTRLNSSH